MHDSPRAAARRAAPLSALRALLAFSLLGALLAACGGEDVAGSRVAGPDDPTTTGGEPSSTDAPTTTRPPEGSGQAVTLAFAGDASFEGLEAGLASDPRGLLSAIAPVLGAADVSMVNLEAALGTGGRREAKTFAFQVPEAALTALGAAGTDVVSMANNHGMDYGRSGLESSLQVRARSEVAVIGIGSDAEDAYRPYVTEVRGQRIGIIAANDVFDSNLVGSWTATDEQGGIASAEEAHQDRLAAEVAELRPQVDTLAVYLHYGTEKETCPNARQRELVDLLVDAGADIVVGSHAHRLQGLGYHGDRFVAYGLSNFVFRSPSDAGRASGVLTVTATGRRIDGYEWSPARITASVPAPLTGDAAQAARVQMDELRACADLTAEPET